MITKPLTRARSGQICDLGGRYRFDGYLSAAGAMPPLPAETKIQLASGQPFPRIASSSRDCWWLLIDEEELADREARRMAWEGGPGIPPLP